MSSRLFVLLYICFFNTIAFTYIYIYIYIRKGSYKTSKVALINKLVSLIYLFDYSNENQQK